MKTSSMNSPRAAILSAGFLVSTLSAVAQQVNPFSPEININPSTSPAQSAALYINGIEANSGLSLEYSVAEFGLPVGSFAINTPLWDSPIWLWRSSVGTTSETTPMYLDGLGGYLQLQIGNVFEGWNFSNVGIDGGNAAIYTYNASANRYINLDTALAQLSFYDGNTGQTVQLSAVQGILKINNQPVLTQSATGLNVASNGSVGVGASAPAAKLHINTGALGNVGQIIRGVENQTANLSEWQGSTGDILAAMSGVSATSAVAAPYNYGAFTLKNSRFSDVWRAANISYREDELYPATGALYLGTSAQWERLFVGNFTNNFYAVNFKNVYSLESVPPLVGMRGDTSLSEDGLNVSVLGASVTGANQGLVLTTGAVGSYISGWQGNSLYTIKNMQFKSYAKDTDLYHAAVNAAYVFTTKENSTNFTKPHTVWSVASQTTPLATLTMDGSLGIGTTTPAAKLHVVGNARFSGAVRIEPQGDLSMGTFTNEP